ncbi:MAG: hypothetical protein Q4A05_09160 [Ruminococcus sp.]|nr:hypothetical protein [Ruminococcus sp.]
MNMDDYKRVTDRIYPSDRCREEVMNMKNAHNRRKIKHRPIGRIIAVVSAAALAACGGTVAAASKLGAFDKLTDKRDRTITYDNGYTGPLDKYDRNEYDKIAPHAAKFEEVSHAENDCFSVDLDSAYYDGLEMILGFTGEMASGNEEGLNQLGFTATLEINGEQIHPKSYDGQNLMTDWWGTFVIDEGENNSFTGSMTCILPCEARFDDTAEVKVTLTSIWSNEISTYDYDTDTPHSYYIMEGHDDGRLELSENVTADTSLVRKINKTAEKDGFYFTVYSISPAMMLCRGGYPESYDIAMNEEIMNGTEDGKAHYVHPLMFVFDEDGNYIEGLPMNPIDMPDGEWASASVSTDSKTLTIKVGDKNCQSNENGSVEFDDQYGHQSFGYITEFTLDLTE